MTFYQELQLNAAGSKEQIRNAENWKSKAYHIAVYCFKVAITLVFCIAVIAVFSIFCGDENRMVGVVIVVSILLFRCVNLEIRLPYAMLSILLMYGMITFGPRLANMANPFVGLLVNFICILGILLLGCHNVAMYNQCILVLSYLLLYGYDVTGEPFRLRMAGMAVGTALILLVYVFRHGRKRFENSWKRIVQEFDPRSSRNGWQFALAFAVSTILLITGLLDLPRPMWAGIAAMSVLAPFRKDMAKRAIRRKIGNIAGGVVFAGLYLIMPESLHSFIGIIGGVGMGFSATYGWQTMFNSLGAMSMAAASLDLRGAVFYRVFHNVFGALYALAIGFAVHWLVQRFLPCKQERQESGAA